MKVPRAPCRGRSPLLVSAQRPLWREAQSETDMEPEDYTAAETSSTLEPSLPVQSAQE